MEKGVSSDHFKDYMKVVGIFLMGIILCLGVFFYCVQETIERNVEKTITDNVSNQKFHFHSFANTQFRYMEGIAAYIGRQDELFGENGMGLLKALNEESGLERVALIDADGMANYDNGEKKDVSERDYFLKSMKGENSLSDPLTSSIDGETRVILSVPVYHGEKVSGVLGGSYNITVLSNLLFEDMYGGRGYSMVIAGDGAIVAVNGNAELFQMKTEENFFAYSDAVYAAQPTLAKQIRRDFSEKKENRLEWKAQGKPCYFSYIPLEINDWMICYAVPMAVAQEEYHFIVDYEMILIGMLALVVLIMIVVLQRIESRRQKALLYVAQTDGLTGIYNRKGTEEEIRFWLKSEERVGQQVFLLLDVDGFKLINDRYGHLIGDEVLRQVGAALRRHFREGDIIGRIGGDEFVVLMKNINGIPNAEAKAEALCEMFRNLTLEHCPDGVKLTCSIGIAYTPDHGTDYQELYRCADYALYQTKQKGRNGYTTYSG